ncbi:diaminobutyrate acetyltransferase [Streptomyces tricolor]|uniref:diaminobutyrate acetyltransferase n=1 Tax=Streptomyces tricolor TaxID=68277 RepID=UPI0036E25C1F
MGAARAKAVFRTPTPEDGLKVWELVADTPGLDTNSPYAYVLWFRDFADCSLVATVDDEIVGFLTGYRRPEEPETYFVWQTAVSPRHGIPFLGVKLFEEAAERQRARGARFVEASVSAENRSILMVLRQYARRRGAEITEQLLFPAELLGDGHHDEILQRIGPLAADEPAPAPHATTDTTPSPVKETAA